MDANRDIPIQFEDFRVTLATKNRFLKHHKYLDYLDDYIEKAGKCDSPFGIRTLKTGDIMYRARICDVKFANNLSKHSPSRDKLWSGDSEMMTGHIKQYKPEQPMFYGYNEENSFVPSEKQVGEGRSNPSWIRYLYAADSVETSIMEVDSKIDNLVSVANIEVQEDLKILRLSQKKGTETDFLEHLNEFLDPDKGSIITTVHQCFTSPCNHSPISYVPSQYLAEHIKNTYDYDGICYHSSADLNGINYTIFNYDKCKAVSSQVYRVMSIKYEISKALPNEHATPSYKTPPQSPQHEAAAQAPTE